MTRPWRRVLGLALLVVALTAGQVVFAGRGGGTSGGGGGGGGTSGGGGATTTPSVPTASDYRGAIEGGSYASAYYQVYRCSVPSPGTYTEALARAVTSTNGMKSRYLSHNVRMLMQEHGGSMREVNRSSDITVDVSGASETNFVTSLAAAQVSYTVSCPRALLMTIEARGWHKGISIHGHSHSFHTRAVYWGQ